MKTRSIYRLAIPIVAICVSLLASDWAAGFSGGSWGSRGVVVSRGSWGSAGCNGGFRTPVRNFLAGLQGPRFWGSGGSVGGCIGGRSLGSYGSVGSQATWGSTGGFGSSGSYASVGGSLGSVGTSYVSTAPTYGYPTMYDSTYSSSVSYPISGVAPTDCVNCGVVVPGGAAVMPDGTYMVPGEAGTELQRSVVPGGQYYEPTPVEPSSPVIPTPGIESDEFKPPTPQPEGETTSIRKPKSDEAVLNLSLPLDAKVYINGRLTKTTGARRSFVSRRLKVGGKYEYVVKAVAQRNGQEVVLERTVQLLAGTDRQESFDFDTPQITQLSVRVPSDATVTLAGNPTKATGVLRHYKTKLKPGQQWNDYKVVVSIEKDGRTVKSEKKIDIVAGETYVLDFQSDRSSELFAAK